MVLAHEAPFQWLQALEQAAKENAKGLPRQEVVQTFWRGIAFRLGQAYLVAPLAEIREVIYCPKALAKVPGAKSWVNGIANIRGQLLPVVDLQACLGGQPIQLKKRNRMLIINQSGVSAGVLVDEVLGIKHFPEDSYHKDVPPGQEEQWLSQFIRGRFSEGADNWTVFDMLALSKSRLFLDAAI